MCALGGYVPGIKHTSRYWSQTRFISAPDTWCNHHSLVLFPPSPHSRKQFQRFYIYPSIWDFRTRLSVCHYHVPSVSGPNFYSSLLRLPLHASSEWIWLSRTEHSSTSLAFIIETLLMYSPGNRSLVVLLSAYSFSRLLSSSFGAEENRSQLRFVKGGDINSLRGRVYKDWLAGAWEEQEPRKAPRGAGHLSRCCIMSG